MSDIQRDNLQGDFEGIGESGSRFADRTPCMPPRPSWDRVANLSTLGMAALLFLCAWLDPVLFRGMLAKDSLEFTGQFEVLTVLFLFLACGLTLPAYRRHFRHLPNPWIQFWVLGWWFASFGFAGEEISWGQWIWGWETPDALLEINRQQETNLHNISSWLSEKPRILIEVFIAVFGVILPLALYARERSGNPGRIRSPWAIWVVAPLACVAPGLLCVLSRWGSRSKDRESILGLFGDGEFKEYAIAWFFLWYLLGLAQKMRQSAAHTEV